MNNNEKALQSLQNYCVFKTCAFGCQERSWNVDPSTIHTHSHTFISIPSKQWISEDNYNQCNQYRLNIYGS